MNESDKNSLYGVTLHIGNSVKGVVYKSVLVYHEFLIEKVARNSRTLYGTALKDNSFNIFCAVTLKISHCYNTAHAGRLELNFIVACQCLHLLNTFMKSVSVLIRVETEIVIEIE